MRGTVAKRIRREIYGDYSSRPEGRKYQWRGAVGNKRFARPYGTIINVGLRQQYQDVKRDHGEHYRKWRAEL